MILTGWVHPAESQEDTTGGKPVQEEKNNPWLKKITPALLDIMAGQGVEIQLTPKYLEVMQRDYEILHEFSHVAEQKIPEVTTLKANLVRALDTADFAAADQELARWAELPGMQPREKMLIIDQRGGVATLRWKFQEAAGHYQTLANLTAEVDPSRVGEYLQKSVESLEKQKKILDDHSLSSAVVTGWRQVVAAQSRQQQPIAWGQAQKNLATALIDLAKTRHTAPLLQEALELFSEAEKELHRDGHPHLWAEIQHDKGVAASYLGIWQHQRPWLEKALVNFKSALEIWQPAMYPKQWSGTWNSIAKTWLEMTAFVKSGDSQAKEAIKAYQEAQKAWPRQKHPLEWGEYQGRIGSIQAVIGEAKKQPKKIREGIKIMQEGIALLAPPLVPEPFIDLNMRLSHALWTLGNLEKNVPLLQESITALEQALPFLKPEKRPEAWIKVKTTLGEHAFFVAVQNHESSLYDKAEESYRDAMTVLTPGQDAQKLAEIQNDLGSVLAHRGEQENNPEKARQGLALFREACKTAKAIADRDSMDTCQRNMVIVERFLAKK
ncbi:MAG: hypothetical protein H7833_06685 [Magnetococcus sp. DMHC-1]